MYSKKYSKIACNKITQIQSEPKLLFLFNINLFTTEFVADRQSV
jgi:hypothetical protein